ncbi:MAG: PAS domain-containing protein [Deltaproteobacteria bacterium]|nr:PAS domain-containing protein [Deltaproteobacteria bacterium]
MVTSGKERQRRWKEKQKYKKQVTVMLSKGAYTDLKRMKEHSGFNYSDIVNKSILQQSQTVPLDITQPHQSEVAPTEHHVRLEKLAKTVNKEFKATNNQLRQEIISRIKAEQSLKESEEKLRFILDNSHDVIFLADLKERKFEYISPSAERVLGYTPEEMKAFNFKELISLIHPDDQERSKEHFNVYKARGPEELDSSIEQRMKHKTLGYRWTNSSRTVMFDEKNKPILIVGSIRDIHTGKQSKIELQRLRDELEKKVQERTLSLDEHNMALRLMLRKEQEIKLEFEEKVVSNVKELVLPYVEKLKMIPVPNKHKKYVDILESNLNEIVSPFLHSLSSRFLGFTPGEIQVANLIRHGRSTKEIAELLNLSIRTIEFHRANIRKKAGIKNKKENLRSYLLAIG